VAWLKQLIILDLVFDSLLLHAEFIVLLEEALASTPLIPELLFQDIKLFLFMEVLVDVFLYVWVLVEYCEDRHSFFFISLRLQLHQCDHHILSTIDNVKVDNVLI
jgi:hypothetical protein